MPDHKAQQPETKHPIRGMDTVLLHGFTQLTTQALRRCVEHGVGVHWLTTTGYHIASIVPTAGQVQRRIRQYSALTDEATCLRLAKALVHAKIEGQHRYLLRATRGGSETREDLLNRVPVLLVHAEPVVGREGLTLRIEATSELLDECMRGLTSDVAHDKEHRVLHGGICDAAEVPETSRE